MFNRMLIWLLTVKLTEPFRHALKEQQFVPTLELSTMPNLKVSQLKVAIQKKIVKLDGIFNEIIICSMASAKLNSANAGKSPHHPP